MRRIAWVWMLMLVAPFVLLASPKNVLLRISDNHCAADLGCYGHRDIRTPHLDELAKRGTQFRRAFATVVSCDPRHHLFGVADACER